MDPGLRQLYVRILKHKWRVLSCIKDDTGAFQIIIYPGDFATNLSQWGVSNIMHSANHQVVRLAPRAGE